MNNVHVDKHVYTTYKQVFVGSYIYYSVAICTGTPILWFVPKLANSLKSIPRLIEVFIAIALVLKFDHLS